MQTATGRALVRRCSSAPPTCSRSISRACSACSRAGRQDLSDAIAEVREAVDFLHFYAARRGAIAVATHVPLGPVVCISPWNFPLAIFTSQIAAVARRRRRW
jgi:delta 1-pyrroline-5-carboxylate dehydrogenase